MALEVRTAAGHDLEALSQLDLTYPTGRVLAVERAGDPPELSFTLRWREAPGSPDAVYASYDAARLRSALERTDLFLVALDGGRPTGLLMVVVPPWTDAGEITDLAVDRRARRRGTGQRLVEAAAAWARGRGLRALWVEPRADNAEAIAFYVSMGFRLSGFNDRMYSNRDDEAGRTTLFMHLEVS